MVVPVDFARVVLAGRSQRELAGKLAGGELVLVKTHEFTYIATTLRKVLWSHAFKCRRAASAERVVTVSVD